MPPISYIKEENYSQAHHDNTPYPIPNTIISNNVKRIGGRLLLIFIESKGPQSSTIHSFCICSDHFRILEKSKPKRRRKNSGNANNMSTNIPSKSFLLLR